MLAFHLADTIQACNKFTLLADDEDTVPSLSGSKTYGMFRLSNDEWELLEIVSDCLAVSFPLELVIVSHYFVGAVACLSVVFKFNNTIMCLCYLVSRADDDEMGDNDGD